jgi:hypothetical protein
MKKFCLQHNLLNGAKLDPKLREGLLHARMHGREELLDQLLAGGRSERGVMGALEANALIDVVIGIGPQGVIALLACAEEVIQSCSPRGTQMMVQKGRAELCPANRRRPNVTQNSRGRTPPGHELRKPHTSGTCEAFARNVNPVNLVEGGIFVVDDLQEVVWSLIVQIT